MKVVLLCIFLTTMFSYEYHEYVPNVRWYKGRKMMIMPPAGPPKTAGNLNDSFLIVDTFAP